MQSNFSPSLTETMTQALGEGDCTIMTGGYVFVFQSADNGYKYKLLANEITSKAFSYYSSGVVEIDNTFYANDVQDFIRMLGAYFFYSVDESQVNEIVSTMTKDIVRNNGALRYTAKGMTFDIHHLKDGTLGLSINDGNCRALARGAIGSQVTFDKDNKRYTSSSYLSLLETIARALR